MVMQTLITIPAPTAQWPAFLPSQRLLEKRRLQFSQIGQRHCCLTFATKFASSARLRVVNSNTTCAATQTQKQTARSRSSTISTTPTKDTPKPRKLYDGGQGFPPWFGSGGGGKGGGGGSSSGGFFLFSLLVFFDYLKELEGDD
ncbi:protein FERTILITY RESTORER RF2, mitochondrial-like [Zingiber officinale]|uniref:protein FERTILITY RESTORER RF2, mitochondrial-like n=1 Tax=Zingiber officinale TaxID=94328 RepID=UPI001C4D0DD2|nr:protein FERTILITY RESTORER RF2, mitochondrial-like [Zingiber officinale]